MFDKIKKLLKQVQSVTSYWFHNQFHYRTLDKISQDLELAKTVEKMLFSLTDSGKKMKGFKVVVLHEDGTERVILEKTGFFWVNGRFCGNDYDVSFTSPDKPAPQPKGPAA